MRKIVQIFLVSWLSIGALGLLVIFVFAGMSYCGSQAASSHIRFPLGEVDSFAVDKEGRIFCYTGSLYRLQVFDKQAGFLKGWFVYTPFHTGKLYLDESNNIHLASSADEHFVFDIQGNKLQQSKEQGIYNEICKTKNQIQHHDSKGNIYKLHHGILSTKLLKVNPAGEESTVVADPFYFFPFRGIFSMLLFFMPPLFILIVLVARNERKRRSEQIMHAEKSDD